MQREISESDLFIKVSSKRMLFLGKKKKEFTKIGKELRAECFFPGCFLSFQIHDGTSCSSFDF